MPSIEPRQPAKTRRGSRNPVLHRLAAAIGSAVCLLFWLSLVVPVVAQSGGDYQLDWHVMGSGGEEFPGGGDYQLGFTLGQDPDPLVSAGGSYEIVQGYWQAIGPPVLEIEKWAQPNTDVAYHGTVTYTVAVTNSGQSNAAGSLLTDTLPSQVDFARWLQDNGAAVSDDEITWSGTITAGEALAWTWVVTHVGDYSEAVDNTARVSQPLAGTGSATAGFRVIGPPELSINKTVTPNTDVAYHGTVTYTVAMTNSGPADAGGTLLTDTLPVSTTFAHWLAQAGAGFDPGPPEQITWNGTVTAGEAITLTFVVSHTGDYSEVVTNTALYSHPTGSGSATAGFTVAAEGAVAGLRAANDSPTALGQITHLTATVSSGDAVKYDWNLGDGSETTGQFAANNYAAVGSYTAVVTASNAVSIKAASTNVTISHAVGTVGPHAGGSLRWGDTTMGRRPITITVEVPGGAVTDSLKLALTRLADSVHPAPGDLRLAGVVFILDAYRNSVLQPHFTFQQPVTVTLRYTLETLDGVAEDTLELRYCGTAASGRRAVSRWWGATRSSTAWW